jgi:ATP-dependent DNA helicase RecQ
LALNGLDPRAEDTKRLIYVALTRAKRRLFIHYNGTYFENIKVSGQINKYDTTPFELPAQIKLLLTHRDVQLGYFEYVQKRLNALQSGDELSILNEAELGYNENRIVKYSGTFKDKLDRLHQKGYRPTSARVNYVVYWKNPANGTVSRIILPVIVLNKEILE